MASANQLVTSDPAQVTPWPQNQLTAKARLISRRCRSVSPPVKRRPLNELSGSTRICQDCSVLSYHHHAKLTENTQRSASNPLIVQLPDDKQFAQPVSPVHVVHSPLLQMNTTQQQPIIKQVTNSYLVRQPKPRRNTMVATAKARAQMLNQYRHSISISSVLDKINHTACSDSELSERKAHKLKTYHPRSSSVPLSLYDDGSTVTMENQSQQISLFDMLPEECTIQILSYLPQTSRGRCMQVCHQWYRLIRLPQLWKDIDFCEIPLCQGHTAQCDHSCYGNYIGKVESFISFLIDIKPRVHRLSFAFDVIQDNWLATLERFFIYVDLTHLEYAHLNWRDTPAKPFWLEANEPRLNDLLYKSRRRQRKFLQMFELFTQEAQNVVSLVLPFDWSTRSIQYLLSLKKLRNLTVEKYFVLQRLCQENLDALSHIKELKRLVLEIWTPSNSDMNQYSIKSKTLEYLDTTQCRGFYLSTVDLPSLQVFLTERKPWNGPLTFHQQVAFPCIRDVLHDGTHNLSRINSLFIQGDLFTTPVDELMKKICACKNHKASITM